MAVTPTMVEGRASLTPAVPQLCTMLLPDRWVVDVRGVANVRALPQKLIDAIQIAVGSRLRLAIGSFV